MSTTSPNEQRDEQLWTIAKKRAGFKRHLITYVIINIFLWAIWYFSPHRDYYSGDFPWPLWTTLGWGVGLAFNYAGAYLFTKDDQTEKEYQKLKNKQL
jgi:hypothetical protein